MRILLLFLLGLFVAGQNAAEVRESWRDNTSVLPNYCKDRAKGAQGSASFSKWKKILGEAYIHMHHYCAGVYSEYKARGTLDSRKRGYWLREAVGQMRYVSGPCKAGCVLYPELHRRWGWALGEQGHISEAIKHYRLAISAKPNYTTAYAGLSDLYVKADLSDEARRVLDAGLKARPKSKKLQRRLQKLNKSK